MFMEFRHFVIREIKIYNQALIFSNTAASLKQKSRAAPLHQSLPHCKPEITIRKKIQKKVPIGNYYLIQTKRNPKRNVKCFIPRMETKTIQTGRYLLPPKKSRYLSFKKEPQSNLYSYQCPFIHNNQKLSNPNT